MRVQITYGGAPPDENPYSPVRLAWQAAIYTAATLATAGSGADIWLQHVRFLEITKVRDVCAASTACAITVRWHKHNVTTTVTWKKEGIPIGYLVITYSTVEADRTIGPEYKWMNPPKRHT